MFLVKYNGEWIWFCLLEGVELDDFIFVGVFGLMDVIDVFDLFCGVKFEMYCVFWICGVMLDEFCMMDWVFCFVCFKVSKFVEVIK